MKKNVKVVGLLISVLFIWGFIGYKIYLGINTKEYPVETGYITSNFSEQPKDEIELTFDYPDPFLKKESRILMQHSLSQDSKSVKKTISPPFPNSSAIINWDKVFFLGTLDIFVVLKINESEFFGKEGSNIEGFIIKKIYNKDSILLQFDNQFKVLKK